MIVVDASVWVSTLIIDDVHRTVSRAWIRDWTLRGRQFGAPILLLSEVTGSVARRARDRDFGHQVLSDMLDDPTLHLFELDRSLGRIAADLAADLFIKGADAVYVALAFHLKAPLVTWDREQLSRASSIIQVFTPLTSPAPS